MLWKIEHIEQNKEDWARQELREVDWNSKCIEQTPEEDERVGHAAAWEKNGPVRGKSQCKSG